MVAARVVESSMANTALGILSYFSPKTYIALSYDDSVSIDTGGLGASNHRARLFVQIKILLAFMDN